MDLQAQLMRSINILFFPILCKTKKIMICTISSLALYLQNTSTLIIYVLDLVNICISKQKQKKEIEI